MIQEERNQSKHSKEVFAYFGLAVYVSQVLEHQLASMIVLLKLSQGKVPTEQHFEELFERKFGSTLGQLVHEIKHTYSLTAAEIEELNEVWKQRNFIVHDFFKERIHDTFTEEGRNEIISELEQFRYRVQKLGQILEQYSHQFMQQIGVTEEMVASELSKVKQL